MSLVNISIVGNVIKPPQQFCFSSGKTKTTLVVAVDVPGRRKESDGQLDSDIYRVEAWGKLGEVAHKYLAKGSLVGATGRLVMNHWQDREGRNRVTPTVEASQIALPPKPKAGESVGGESHINPVAGELQFDELDAKDTQPVQAEGGASPVPTQGATSGPPDGGTSGAPEGGQSMTVPVVTTTDTDDPEEEWEQELSDESSGPGR